MPRMIPKNQVTLLTNGAEYFQAVEAALDRAMHDIYLEAYIFENDNTGRRIAEELRRAVQRGVKTHLLIDEHWATVGSSNLDPFSLLLSLEANVVIDDENFAIKLKNSLEKAIDIEARWISESSWKEKSTKLCLMSGRYRSPTGRR